MRQKDNPELIYYDTKSIIEALLWRFPKFRIAFLSLGIISPEDGRTFQPMEHKELSGALSSFNFEQSYIVTIIGSISVTAIISSEIDTAKMKTRPVLYIIGEHCRVE